MSLFCSEVILCDFTAGATVVSFLNIVRVPGLPRDICKSSFDMFPGDGTDLNSKIHEY